MTPEDKASMAAILAAAAVAIVAKLAALAWALASLGEPALYYGGF